MARQLLLGAAVLAGVEVNGQVREALSALRDGKVGAAYRTLEAADQTLGTLQHALKRMEASKGTA